MSTNYKELFEKGYTFEVFKGSEIHPNSLKVMQHLNPLIIDETVINRVLALQKPHYALCIGENWCPDCVINERVLHHLEERQPLIKVCYLPREGYEDFVASFDPEGKARIPLILLLNAHFELKGTINEIPKALKHIVDGGNQVEIIVAKKKYRHGELVNETAMELLDTFELSE